MTGWLKRFTLSLFSDNRAKESVKFGFGNILLTSILSVAFIFLSIFAGETVPFASYYKGAEDFRMFLYSAFGTGLSVNVGDGDVRITLNGQEVAIDTVADADDGAAYSLNGYHLFVNSARVTETYDDFTAYCVNSDGKEISYGDYLSLGETERKNYRFNVRYSGKTKKLTAEDIAAYTAYLKGLDDSDINSQLEASDGTDGYIYALYIKTYYPDMVDATGEYVPTLRNYYYRQTLKTDGKYLCLFGDMLIASFESYNSNVISYGGTYSAGNELSSGSDSKAVDRFFRNTFYDGAATMFIIDLMDSIAVIAVTELIIVGVMLLAFAVSKLKKRGCCLRFANGARIVASYSHVAALLSAVVTFCLSFAFAGAAIRITAFVSFAAILAIRTVVLLLREKEEPPVQEEEQ